VERPDPYTDAMTAQPAKADSPKLSRRDAGARTLRVESAAVYIAFISGAIGAVYGLVVSFYAADRELFGGEWSFGIMAAIGSAIIAAIGAAIGYWRARLRPGEEWRLSLPAWKYTVNTISVVIAHTALAFLATYATFRVLSLGFVGLPVIAFWAVVLMAVALGLTGYFVFLSVSRMTTQRMSSLLMSFIVLGTLTSMVTTPDKEWWEVHFSQLGTFDDLSSWVFNGTLIAGGLLVTSFAVYIAIDMDALIARGRLTNPRSSRIVSSLFVVMGIMLAFVGIVPVDVNLLIHNLSATGMAIVFLVLLIGGPKLLAGMPPAYFISSWSFLGATVASAVLFAVGYFGLTAFEILVFALIFGWISVFIRFLGAAGMRD
jgi:hypothetical membrane protein